jgi:hypothetical protein
MSGSDDSADNPPKTKYPVRHNDPRAIHAHTPTDKVEATVSISLELSPSSPLPELSDAFCESFFTQSDFLQNSPSTSQTGELPKSPEFGLGPDPLAGLAVRDVFTALNSQSSVLSSGPRIPQGGNLSAFRRTIPSIEYSFLNLPYRPLRPDNLLPQLTPLVSSPDSRLAPPPFSTTHPHPPPRHGENGRPISMGRRVSTPLFSVEPDSVPLSMPGSPATLSSVSSSPAVSRSQTPVSVPPTGETPLSIFTPSNPPTTPISLFRNHRSTVETTPHSVADVASSPGSPSPALVSPQVKLAADRILSAGFTVEISNLNGILDSLVLNPDRTPHQDKIKREVETVLIATKLKLVSPSSLPFLLHLLLYSPGK